MRSIVGILFFWALGASFAGAVTIDSNFNKYKVYQSDLNGDGRPDYYFHGVSLFVLIHGDIATPIALPAPESFVLYSHGDKFLTPIAETYTDAQIATKNLQITSTTSSNLQSFIANATIDPNSTGIVQTPVAPEIAAVPAAVSSIDLTRAIPAEFDVNNSGQATYKIPVITAPGSAGLVPNVSLNYSSGGGNGIAGLGWSLSAYGAISRCRQTEGIDGVAKPITWTSEDRFCLNGERLLLASGTYGASGSTYKTEIDSFTRVTAVGGVAGHPDYFTVEYKDGIIETYGNTTDSSNSKNQLSAGNSSTVLDWALSKRSDSADNKIVFTYVKDVDGQRIDTIDYAFGATSTRGAYLQLNYESRNDPISGYVAGHAYKTGKRLSGVKSYNGTTEIRNYTLTYNQGTAYTTNDKLSRINKVQECVGAVCSPATEFEWELIQNDIKSGQEVSFLLTGGIGLPGTNAMSQIFADINGDKSKDIVWIDASGKLRYAFSTTNSNHAIQFSYGVFPDKNGATDFFTYGGNLRKKIQAVDLNADGRDDLVIDALPMDRESIVGRMVFLSLPLANGEWALTKIAFDTNLNDLNAVFTQFADFNGDGLVDIIAWRMLDNGVGNWTFEGSGSVRYLQKGSGSTSENNLYKFSEQESIESFAVYCQRYQKCTYEQDSVPEFILSLDADFDGDGKSDVLSGDFTGIDCTTEDVDGTGEPCKNKTYKLAARTIKKINGQSKLIAYGGDQLVSSDTGLIWDPAAFRTTKAIDLNHDGLSDLIYGGRSQLRVRLNTGAGFSDYQTVNIPGNGQKEYPTFNDVNGDGYQDIVWIDNGASIPTNGSKLVSVRAKFWSPATNTFEENSVELFSEYKNFGSYSYRLIDPYLLFHGLEWVTATSHPEVRPQLIDFNGDGFDDWVKIPVRDTGAVSIKLNRQSSAAGNKIVSISNGLGVQREIQYQSLSVSEHYSRIDGIRSNSTSKEVCTTIYNNQEHCWDVVTGTVDASDFYEAINDPWFDLTAGEQSLSPASPVLEAFGPVSVVTGVEVSAPSGNVTSAEQVSANAIAKLSYYYGQAKMQAGGRGFLGFKYFTVVNGETGIRTETEYRQDWPYIGQPRKIRSFTATGHKLNEQENIWGLVNCYDAAGNANASCISNMSSQVDASGTGALGAVKPFLRKSTTKTYALKDNGITQGDLLSTSIETNRYDTNGNVLEAKTITSSDLGLPTLTKTTTNLYSYSGNSWSMQQGRLENMTVAANEPTYGTITRKSSFTYYQSGAELGLLNTETVEPDNSNFTVTTTHYYNQGNRYKSVTTADGQTRQMEVGYDSRGRYVDNTYAFLTNGTAPDTPIRRLASQVVGRDKYGTPTEIRNYTSSTNYVTKKVATTTFGIPYFTADSTGAFTEIKIGAGSDTYGVCPADNKVWAVMQSAGGAMSIECKDILGRVRRMGTIGFDGADWSLVDTEYDKLGRVLRTSAPYWRNSSERYWTSQNYDVLGRVVETRSPYKTSYVTTTTSYINQSVEIRNPKNQLRIEKRNLAGQVYEVIDPNNGITKFAYDARGNMREMRDPALNTTIIGYDLRDRKVSMSDPDKGSWIYKYNRFGDMICQMDGKGQISVQRYDISGRLFSRTDRLTGGNCDAPTGAVEKYSQWVYDTASNGMGQLAHVLDSTTVGGAAQYQQTYAYDGFGRMSGITTTMPGVANVSGSHYEKFTYDQFGRPFQTFDAARTSASFNTNGIQNVYNARGYLQKVVDAVTTGGSQQAYYTVKAMDARGNVTSAEYGNGVTQSAAYYPETGLTKLLRANRALVSLPLQDTSLDWDEIGNLDWREERGTAGDPVRRNIREDFEYDTLNRLNVWVSSGDLVANETANYNSIDNITSKTGIGNYLYGGQCGTGTNAGPHALCRAGSVNYFYDKNGNMLNDSTGRVMKYTTYDLPSEISKSGHKTQFSYGPNRARYKRVDTSSTSQVTTTLYLGSVEKVHYPDGTIQWKRNIAGVGLITQTVNASGTKLGEAQRYLIKDHLGSLSLITDEIGAVEQSNYFDPWGRERKIITSGTVKQWLADNANFRIAIKPITTRGFTGHEQLAEVGLIHMNGRIYDGALGRFVQADPIIQDPLRVQSLNRYSYVWNNPLNATDPSGFECVDVGHDDKKCTPSNNDKVEEVKVEGSKQPASQRNSGFSYTITNPAALEQWLKDNNMSMDDFSSMMKDQGVSKASGSNRARAGSGVLLANGTGNIVGAALKEKNVTAIYALGEVSAAADEVIGSAQEGTKDRAISFGKGLLKTELGFFTSRAGWVLTKIPGTRTWGDIS
ncbi:hypothetical protein CBP51_10065 [Cellvibrio mixtus]|uniref:Insecticide toxin TcdB middle/N-terminal domain-containing protein n=1 Tax=Cellvibrio mixtus TaxID=39650 RepID=A0A266QBW8_9GAMM|nr:FG-GAP-like repeat-containing protein [Cellvibrio mixtus]OZY87300.1 hypothetical protein CBP51_10065 [Cellvibrio mixtus]